MPKNFRKGLTINDFFFSNKMIGIGPKPSPVSRRPTRIATVNGCVNPASTAFKKDIPTPTPELATMPKGDLPVAPVTVCMGPGLSMSFRVRSADSRPRAWLRICETLKLQPLRIRCPSCQRGFYPHRARRAPLHYGGARVSLCSVLSEYHQAIGSGKKFRRETKWWKYSVSRNAALGPWTLISALSSV